MNMLRFHVVFWLVAFALASFPSAAAEAADPPPGLRPMEPIRCVSDEDLEIRGRYISTDGNGIETSGNCDVEVYDSYIEAGDIGVLADGNSDVELYNTHVEGRSAALLAQGNADISMSDSRIVGGTVVRGNGGIDDEGGNETSGRASMESGANSAAGGEISVGPGGVRVGTGADAVVVGPGGVRVGAGTDAVVVDADRVRVQSGGQVVEVTGDWRGAGSVYAVDDTERLLVELGATMDGGELHLQMAGDVLFDFNSAAIRPDSARELAKVAHLIRQRSEGVVAIVGHTDSVGDAASNMKLSEQRALAVMRWLDEHEGIPPALMRADGVGETQPLAYNTMPDGSDNPDGRAQNRRVEISFLAGTATVAAVHVQPPAARPASVRAERRTRRTSALSDSCARICKAWPRLSELQAACVSTTLELSGYQVIGNYACIDVDTTGECVACWRSLQVSEAECAKLQRDCLGG